MPATLAEDIVFILFFFSLFTVLMTGVPYIYKLLRINNDDMIIIILWLILFILFGILLKYLQNQRYKDELNDIEDILDNNDFNI